MSKKHQSISLRLSLHTGRHLSGVSPTTSLTSYLYTALTTKNITDKKLYYFARTKHDGNWVQCIFNCNTLFNGHMQRTVRFPQRKPLPRSTANSAVTVCSCSTNQEIPNSRWNTKTLNPPLVLSWARCPCEFNSLSCLTLRRLMSYIYIYIYIWSTHSWCF